MSSCARVTLTLFNIAILIYAVIQIIMSTTPDQPIIALCSYNSASSLQWMGIFFLVVSIIGLMGSCFRIKAVESIYLWVLVIWTGATIVFALFIYASMPGQSPYLTFNAINREGFWLKQYRPVLQTALVNEKDWYRIKTCYKETHICDVLKNVTNPTTSRFVQTGCCFPPYRCLKFNSNTSLSFKNMDDECKTWSKLGVGKECFDCDSCKAAYLANFQEQWDSHIVDEVLRILFLVAASGFAFYVYKEDEIPIDPKHGKHVRI
ncbi:hypothetical protein ABFS82_08G038500 [Erythranthe guttata]|uniref:Tetraspanin n=1 Tax=Erythranthe guttata TaxID=4155 RepID=A0A022RZ74_ERYGU|nr:PREDICTED: tetraspanin-8-like [Erythranthe guttata]EYU44280.1 hypothetical protein MIMGU_mgv1a012081mg [Erythranthe guttata]|eukprot:XP_012852348.1 PREDICTED: tetraspanin-8-like [Erythranthe guttata]